MIIHVYIYYVLHIIYTHTHTIYSLLDDPLGYLSCSFISIVRSLEVNNESAKFVRGWPQIRGPGENWLGLCMCSPVMKMEDGGRIWKAVSRFVPNRWIPNYCHLSGENAEHEWKTWLISRRFNALGAPFADRASWPWPPVSLPVFAFSKSLRSESKAQKLHHQQFKSRNHQLVAFRFHRPIPI